MKNKPIQSVVLCEHPSDIQRLLDRMGENGKSFRVGHHYGDWGLGEGDFFVEVNNYYEGKWIELNFYHRHSSNHCLGANPSILEVMFCEDVNMGQLRELGKYLVEITDWMEEDE